jgi:hypothetical protein
MTDRSEVARDNRNAIAKARDEYLGSPDGAALTNPATLCRVPDSYIYLRNRIEAAFLAGWAARERQEKNDGN